jgi:hypothetical protein
MGKDLVGIVAAAFGWAAMFLTWSESLLVGNQKLGIS